MQAAVSTARPLQPVPRAAPPRRAPLAVMAATGNASAPGERQQAPWQAAAAGCFAALLLAAPGPALAKDLVEGFPRVVDGDTLDFSGTRVRLFGIDAPETKQSCKAAKGAEYSCGESSKQALQQKIGKQKVQCEQKNRDKYGRIVGICSLPRPSGQLEDLNAWMVQEGYAVAYRQYSKAYVPLEDQARAAGKGIWSGSFEMPQQWRIDNPRGGSGSSGQPAAAPAAVAAAAGAAAQPAPKPAAGAAAAALPVGDCKIKGNITAKGEKIYHVPGGAYYDRTVIVEAEGERYFCTAAEAEAAGWRAASK